MSNRHHDSPTFRFVDFLNFNSYYWNTRQWRYFRQGIPAIVVSLLILIPAIAFPLTRKHSARRYQVAFNQAVKKQNYETAHLFLKKLQDLPTEELETKQLKFNQALTDIARGRTDQGLALMQELAPADAVGYGPAHLWLAQQQGAEDPSLVAANSDSIVHHYEAAIKSERVDASVRVALGNYYYRNGKPARAIEHLQSAVETHPELHFVLANLHESLGDEKNAKAQYELASSSLAAKEDKQSRINLAICYYRLDEFDKAVGSLMQGIDPSAPDQQLIDVLSTLYLQESDRLRLKAKPDAPEFAKSLMLLSRAIDLAPNNTNAINRIALIAGYEGETGLKAVETLKQLLAEGKMTATAHVILGTEALNRGNIDVAKRHFTIAYRQDPKMPVLLNNIAWLLANDDPPQLEQALTIINEAIAETPPSSQFYPLMVETRGQTYVKLKRWEAALTDLELALQSISSAEIHRSLAVVYGALGDETLAKKHDSLSKRPKR